MSSRRVLPEGAPPPRYGNFSVVASVTAASAATIDLRTNTAFKALCVAFESVELVSAEAMLSFPACDKPGRYIIAFHPSNQNSFTEWQSNASSATVYGCKYFSKEYTLSLRPDHSFGTELKSTVLGNSHPVLSVSAQGFASDSGDIGTVQLRFRAAFHGSSLG